MRWSEADLERYLRQGPDGALTEKALQSAVQRLARAAGYTFQYHTWDSRRSMFGYPDLTLVHRDPGYPLLMLEVKTATGHVTVPQQAWLDALAQCTAVHAQVVRPADLEALVALLRGA